MRALTTLLLCGTLLAICSSGQHAAAGGMTTKLFIQMFNQYFSTAEAKSAAHLVELGIKAKTSGLYRHSKKCFEAALVQEPDNKLANQHLGRVKVGKVWMSTQARDAASRKENEGKLLWGDKFVTPETRAELLKAERARVGWNFTHFFNTSEFYTMYFEGENEDEAWSISRLVENTLWAFDLEFGPALGRPKNKLTIHIFSTQEGMNAYVAKATGQAASAPNIFDSRTMAAYAMYGGHPEAGRDMVVEALIRGMLGLHGNNGNVPGHWFHLAFLYYFRMARVDDETVFPGYYRSYQPDLLGIAKKLSDTGLYPSIQALTTPGPEGFVNDGNFEQRASAWALFHILNHEFQGMNKKDFHEYIKGAVKGRADYKNLKKVKNLGAIEKTITALIFELPEIDDIK